MARGHKGLVIKGSHTMHKGGKKKSKKKGGKKKGGKKRR